jgi:hypothetical protein
VVTTPKLTPRQIVVLTAAGGERVFQPLSRSALNVYAWRIDGGEAVTSTVASLLRRRLVRLHITSAPLGQRAVLTDTGRALLDTLTNYPNGNDHD